MQNLRSKIAIFGLSISLLTGFVMSIYTLKSNLEYFKRNHEKDARFKLESIIQTIRSNSAKIKSDALFLASTPPIEGILRAKRNNGIDPKDKSSIETWKLRLQKIFEEMLYINSDYMQIRYIGVDDNGREIVRSERFGNKVSSFKEVDLQKKGDRVYFKKTLENFQHKVYFSRITANKELGKVVYPIQMVLRAGVPVFENIKRPFGGVFINANYSSLFKGLDFFQDNRHLLLVKDELGQALISYKNGFKFYHEEGKANLKHEDFFEDSSDHPPIFKQKIHYNDLNPDQYLEISFSLAENQLSGDLKKALFSEFFILLAMLLLVGFISFIISKKFVAPLEELSRLTKKLESETYTESDLVYSKDKSEVGELTNTLIRMTKNVKTSRKQVEDQKKALDSAAIVVETDRFGKITYVNEKFVEISGYTRGELLGKDHRIVNSGYHTKEFFRELWSTIKDGLIWSGEVKNKTKSGDFYWVDTTIYPVLNDFGETEKYIAIRLDITDQKLIQEKYRRSVETKSNFLANMSHEIRTPLNGIIGFSDILVKKDLDGESKTEVEHIKSCSEGLLQIVNDILDISKIESGKLEFNNENFSFYECVKASHHILINNIKKAKIKFTSIISDEIAPLFIGDELRIRQVLINLLGNAVKFTPEYGKIELKVDVTENDGVFQYVKVSIKDTGIGIKKENINKLFTSFNQADNSISKKYGGTGLGLAICKNIIEKMNGKIWIESEVGVGTNIFFTLKLPMVTAKLKETKKEEVSKNEDIFVLDPSHSMNILVVEDNVVNQLLLKKMLSQFGQFKIDLAENGVEAIECIKKKSYPLVFMDVQMPTLDGVSATKIIRAELNYQGSIVGLSANAFKEDNEKALKAGMDFYLSKPINFDKLQGLFKKLSEEKNFPQFIPSQSA